jgi:hypothetical protein
MKKLSINVWSIILILLLFMSIFVYLMLFIEPKITIKAEINPITDLDYNRIKERSEPFIETAKKDDFKKVYLEIRYSEPLILISNRKIEFNHLFTPSDSGRGIVNLSGGTGENDNPNKSRAEYTESAEVFLNGKSIDDLKGLFENHEIKISWDKLGAGRQERIYYLKDLIEIK